MANNDDQIAAGGQIQTQAQVQELLTQLEYAPSQLASTADLNSQSQDDSHDEIETGPTMDNLDNDILLIKSKFNSNLQSKSCMRMKILKKKRYPAA